MESFKFRPRLDGLEDRTVPSITPEQVVGAYTRVTFDTDAMHGLLDTINEPKTARTLQFIRARLPQIAAESAADGAVLNTFVSELRANVAANPALYPVVGPTLEAAQRGVVQAVVNGAYANLLGPGFGVVPPVPPVPPVVDSPPDFGTVPTPAGITTTNPPGSTLPFSLSDPSWQNQPSGVRTWDVTPGTGTAARVGGQVSFSYTGYLLDGTVFDSTAAHGGTPLSTTLDTSHLIAGFVNGIAGMQVGGTRRIQIPADQAYGSAGTTGVPPNSELVFEVNLISAS